MRFSLLKATILSALKLLQIYHKYTLSLRFEQVDVDKKKFFFCDYNLIDLPPFIACDFEVLIPCAKPLS